MTFCSTVAISIELAKPGAPGKVAAAARKRRKDLINGIARCSHLCSPMCWSRWGGRRSKPEARLTGVAWSGPCGRRGIDTCALSQRPQVLVFVLPMSN